MPPDQAVDSFDLSPVLLGKQSEDRPVRDYLLNESREIFGFHVPSIFSITNRDSKLIFDFYLNPAALVDLETDPSETVNQVYNSSYGKQLSRLQLRFFQAVSRTRTAPLLHHRAPRLRNDAGVVPGTEPGLEVTLEMDGGLGMETIGRSAAAGARLLVAGSAVFGAEDPVVAMGELRRLAEEAA